jgi:serine/threonine-protein kinase
MIGQTLGEYRIEERIGRGGMDTVYRATDETLHREVAIKVLNPELNEPEVARRFRAEAVTVARLNHPGIATIYELFEHEGQCFMVMEFVRGETLERLVERAGPLPVEQAADLQVQALTALGYAHKVGIIHRDLKPANLMVTESGAIKVMDFGIARVAGSEHLTTAGFMMGTPAYMAPEQVRGEEVDARTDLYAMGVVLYRLTTAKLPFKGDTPFLMAQSQINDPPTPAHVQRAGLPDWIEQILMRALAKAPSARFQTADEFRDALRRGLAGLDLPVPPDQMETTPPHALPTLPSAAPTTGSASRTPASGTAPMPMASLPPTPVVAPAPAVDVAPVAGSPWVRMATQPVVAMAGMAAVIVLLAAGIWWWRGARQAPPVTTPQATASSTSAPAPAVQATAPAPPVQVDVPAPTPPVQVAVPSPAPPAAPKTLPTTTPATPLAAKSSPLAGSATASSPEQAGKAAPAPPAGGPVRGSESTSPRAGAPLPPAAPPAPEVPDVHVAYNNVKLLTVKGTNSEDRDVVVNFVGGQISVMPAKSGEALFSIGYKSVVQATYVHARDPKWDPSLASPAADKFDLPGMFHPAHHWLVLQGQSSFVILRLDDTNFARVLDTVASRTGVKVSRPTAGQ